MLPVSNPSHSFQQLSSCQAYLKNRVNHNLMVNVIESSMYFNIAVFALITLYTFNTTGYRNTDNLLIFQTVAACISVTITFLLLLGIIIFHIYRHGSSKIRAYFGHSARLNEMLNDQSEFELSVSRNVTTTVVDDFLDAIDHPRERYNSHYKKAPTKTVVPLPKREQDEP